MHPSVWSSPIASAFARTPRERKEALRGWNANGRQQKLRDDDDDDNDDDDATKRSLFAIVGYTNTNTM